MPQPIVTRHTHSLPDPSLKRKSIIRSLFGSLVKQKTKRPGSSKGQASEQLAIQNSQPHFSRELTEKYGTPKSQIGSGGSSLVWLFHKPEAAGTPGQFFAIKGFRRDSKGNEKAF